MSGTGLLQQPLCDSLVPIMIEEIQGLSSGSLLFMGGLRGGAVAVHEGFLLPVRSPIPLTAETGQPSVPTPSFPPNDPRLSHQCTTPLQGT